MDPQIDTMMLEGMAAIEALPEHASRIAGLLATHFPAQTLAAVLETLKNVKMKRSRKDLAIQKLFPDYDWSLKNIEGDLGHKFKAETQFS